MNKKGSIFIYAIILVNLAVFLAFIIFTKSEILLKNADYQEYEYIMSRNIAEKADQAVQYDKNINSDGYGYQPVRCCPSSITLSGITNATVVPQMGFAGNVLFCDAKWATNNSLRLLYQGDFEFFSSGAYNGQIGDITIGATSYGAFATASGILDYSFALPPMCDIDANMNSDNYSIYSTGAVLYATGGTVNTPINATQGAGDNDVLARDTSYGYIKRNAGYYNIFFNPSKATSLIKKNKNNLKGATSSPDELHAFLSDINSGYLYLDIDQPAQLKIVEFSSGSFNTAGELKRISEKTYNFNLSGYGFLQQHSSPALLSGSLLAYPSSSSYISPEPFDFKNKLYGFFLSYSGSTAGVSDFLTYKMRIVDGTTGKLTYIVPIDDSEPGYIKYLGYDIIFSQNGGYYYKDMLVSRPK